MITNNMKLLTPVEIKSTSEDKISINPREIKLSHLQKQRIIVELRMHKPFAEKNGVKVPIKESIFIKSDNFNQTLRVFINPETSSALPGKYLSNSSQDVNNSEKFNENEEFENLLEQKSESKEN